MALADIRLLVKLLAIPTRVYSFLQRAIVVANPTTTMAHMDITDLVHSTPEILTKHGDYIFMPLESLYLMQLIAMEDGALDPYADRSPIQRLL